MTRELPTFWSLFSECFSRKTSKTPSTPMYQQWGAKMCERYGSGEYSVPGLGTKYQRMKKRYRICLRVSTNTSIGWDEESQTCHAPPEIIKEFAQVITPSWPKIFDSFVVYL